MEEVDERTDSGQAIILAGLAIAIGIVVVAVYLNAMIFSANLDARGIHIDSEEVSEVSYLTTNETEYQMERVRNLNNSPDDAEEQYVSAMENFTESVQLLPSSESAVVKTDTWRNRSAWQVVQNNSQSNLDGAAGDEEEWDVAQNVNEPLVLDFYISLDGLDESKHNLTRIKAHTATDDAWQMYVVNKSMNFGDLGLPTYSEDTVVIEDESGTIQDNYSSSSYGNFKYGESNYLHIEVLTGEGTSRLNGTDTNDNLHFPNPGNVQRISIEWGNVTEGEYEIRVDGDATGDGPCAGDPCKDASGWTTGMVHRSNYTLTHIHPRSTFRNNVSVTYPREIEP